MDNKYDKIVLKYIIGGNMKDTNLKKVIIVEAMVFILCIGIGWAALSTQLNINGTGTVTASSWKIEFDNLSRLALVGTAVEDEAPTLSNNNTYIGDFEITFITPGDSVSYAFDVVNLGTFDAEISSINNLLPSCESTSNDEDDAIDAQNVCDNLSYTLVYSDNNEIVKTGDELLEGETKRMILTLAYNSTIAADKLPKNDVKISNLDVSIIYSPK